MISNSQASQFRSRLGRRHATTVAMILVPAILVFTFGVAPTLHGGQENANPIDDPDEQFKILKPAMEKKLKLTHELITSLTVEDFDKLAENAQALKRIGRDTLWKVSPNVTFIKYSSEFTAIADELARSASEHDLNGATLAYVRLTINCVDCHRYVRKNRILDPKLRRE